MLLADIKTDITESLKKGDHVRAETLRFLLAAIRNTAIAVYGNKGEEAMTDQNILDVIKKQVKAHKESILAFQQAGRQELVDKESQELAILNAFLPQEISDEELKALLSPVIAGSDSSNFGLLMKAAMAKVAGQADGKRVSAMIKLLLPQV